MEYFNANPGTYFKTSGWIERSDRPEEINQLSISRQSGMDSTYEELVAKYGEDNAKFLYDSLVDNAHFYSRLTYIKMGVEPDDRFERTVRDEAQQRKWDFDEVEGDMGLIQRLMDGEWNEQDFLVVPRGCRIIATHDDAIIGTEEVK
jgi:hypothetical protein